MSQFNRQQQDDIRRIVDRHVIRKNNGNGAESGTSDHGTLTGLADDDHPQYHNDTRGDARYYTKSQSDAGFATSSHTHSVGSLQQSGATTGQYLSWNGTTWAPVSQPSATLTSDSAFLGADVALTNANQWYSGPSLALPSGTWLVMASATAGRTTTTAGNYNIRISTGTVHYASVQQYHASVANNFAALSCNAIITLGSTTTIVLQASGTIAGDVLKAATPNNASGNNATGLVAVRIA